MQMIVSYMNRRRSKAISLKGNHPDTSAPMQVTPRNDHELITSTFGSNF